MFRMDEAILKLFRFTLCAVLITLSSSSVTALESNDRNCAKANLIHHDDVVRQLADSVAGPQCFETYLPSAGVLTLDAMAPIRAQAEPRFVLSSQNCGSLAETDDLSFVYLERTATNMILEIRQPGSLSFCVDSQDPEESLGDYALRIGFAPSAFEKNGEDPEEEEPDPEPMTYPNYPSIHPSVSSPALRDICRRNTADDHGDTFLCASPLRLGQEVNAEIWDAWGGDDDVFTFALEELTTVHVETSGDTDTIGSLHGRNGDRLKVGDNGGGDRNFRIVKTLSPGRYFVRVTGSHGTAGAYQLAIEDLEQ